MPRTAVFDLDGTLAETAPDLVGAANVVLADMGAPPLDPVADRSTAGRGGRALLRLGLSRLGGAVDDQRVEDAIPTFLDVYRGRIDWESTLYPGAVEMLRVLGAKDWRLAVCTNKPEDLALILLERLGVLDFFGQAVIGADTLPVRKPHAEPVWEAIDRAGGSRGRAVMLGDTVTDRAAARAASIPCLLFRHGYMVEPEAELAPEAVLDGFDGLAEALEKLSPADGDAT